MDYPIRNVTFGGFDRQDVVRYLENFSRSAEEEKQALREENDRLTARAEELEGENAALRRQLEEARDEAAGLREQLEQEAARRAELESLRGLEEENARLRGEAASLRRDAAAYARFRERVGSIECEARERADALETGASEKMRRTMLQFQERYQELIRVIESTAGHVTGELRKVEVNLSQLPRAMDQADREFDDISVQISRGEYVPEETLDGADGGGTASPVEGPDGGGTASPVEGPDGGGTASPMESPDGGGTASPMESPDGGGTASPMESPDGGGTAAPAESPEETGDQGESVREPLEEAEPAEGRAVDEQHPAVEEQRPAAEEQRPAVEEQHPAVEEQLSAAEEQLPPAETDSRPGSLRDAIQTAASAKAPKETPEARPVRTVRPSVQNRDGRNGLFGFGTRRR